MNVDYLENQPVLVGVAAGVPNLMKGLTCDEEQEAVVTAIRAFPMASFFAAVFIPWLKRKAMVILARKL